jgi:hypothetical protein
MKNFLSWSTSAKFSAVETAFALLAGGYVWSGGGLVAAVGICALGLVVNFVAEELSR